MKHAPLVWVCLSAAIGVAHAQIDRLDSYNIVWNSASTPAQGSSGSMPIGNGELGANVWVEQGGDLLLLLSRTDSWSENERLLKLGRLRLHMDPNPFTKGAPFTQTLVLRDGRLEIVAGEPDRAITLNIWVDSLSPTLRVTGEASSPVAFTATLECWRTERRTITDADELKSAWAVHSAPKDVEIWESADVFTSDPARKDAIVWYHRNDHSIVPMLVKHQGLAEVESAVSDPLTRRTFGGHLWARGLARTAPSVLSGGLSTSLDLRLTTHSEQSESAEAWIARVCQMATPFAGPDASRIETERWWREYWDRSWIYVEGDPVSGTGGVPVNGHALKVGADSNGQNRFRGELASPLVFDRALDAERIAELASGTRENRWANAAGLVATDTLPGRSALPAGVRAFQSVGQVAPKDGAWELGPDGGSLSLPDDNVPPLRGLTVSAWVKPALNLGPARIFDKMTAGGSDGFIFDTHPGSDLRLICGAETLVAPSTLTRGEWQHAAATCDERTGELRIYLDGKLVASSSGNPGEGDGPRDVVPPSRVTQAYILQKWMTACAGRGAYPIKFNGSIFTVEPAHTNAKSFNPDWRAWGGCFWWQNTRLPYYPMLARGDFEMLDPLFDLYQRVLPICAARTRLYHNAQGAYFPETMTTFGTYSNGDYGWKREGLDRSNVNCPWWQFSWQQGLELAHLMLDRYDYTLDEQFLVERAIPIANESLRYFDSRFKRDEAGKLLISPTQAVETYWYEVVNDAPTVAGVRAVCDQLLALPAKFGTPQERALWTRMKAAAPTLPTWDVMGKRAAAPAEKFKNQRNNCETPELYPLFPFRLYGPGRINNDLAINAYHARVDKSMVGWTQDGTFAAMLGLTDEAKANLLAKSRNSHRNFRFPAMWGPNFDWLPDQDHGGNLTLLLQDMLMQCDSGKIYLLPAWPKEWSASFKLRAPGRTVVEGRVENGAVTSLRVTPESRRKDIVFPQ
jgi:hypothetical protein